MRVPSGWCVTAKSGAGLPDWVIFCRNHAGDIRPASPQLADHLLGARHTSRKHALLPENVRSNKPAEALLYAPADLEFQLLCFLSGVIFGIYVIDTPWPSAVDLNNGFFIREGIVRHAWLEREEASSW
jgi:hypothetical protein